MSDPGTGGLRNLWRSRTATRSTAPDGARPAGASVTEVAPGGDAVPRTGLQALATKVSGAVPSGEQSSPRPVPPVVSSLRRAAPPRSIVGSRTRRVTLLAVGLDLFAIADAYLLAHVLERPVGGAGPHPPGRLPMVVTVAVWAAAFGAYRLYDRRRLASAGEEARRVFHAVSVGVISLVVAAAVLGVDQPRGRVAALWVASLVTVGLSRYTVRLVVKAMNCRRYTGTRVLVVGTNEEARTIARTLTRQPWRGFSVSGFVADGVATEMLDGHPVVGSVPGIAEAVRRVDAGAVIVAGSAVSAEDLLAVDRALQALDVEVRVSPGLPHVGASRVALEPIDGLALLALRRPRFTRGQRRLKRSFDLVGAVLLLALTFPLLALIALAVRLTSRGPALFHQVRVGEAGRPFVMLKFRTMIPDAELRLDELRSSNEAEGVLFKLQRDPRVTSLGRLLRRSGLDELPQVFNVLRGEMSLVGPRPALLSETELYNDRLRQRLRVKPGLTGLWQVNGRHDLPFDDYMRYDLFYVENWSLALDLYVIARTIPALLSRRGAY